MIFGNISIFVGISGSTEYLCLAPGTNKLQKDLLPKLENVYKNFLAMLLNGKRPYFFLGGTFRPTSCVAHALRRLFLPRWNSFP